MAARLLKGTLAISSLALTAGLACSQDFPNKPIRLLTAAVGGGSDFTARQVAQGITNGLGQPVVVENRPSGLIGGQIVAKAPPDGYSMTVQGLTPFALTQLWREKPYDAVKDFSPVVWVEKSVSIVVVHPSVAANSIKELIALAKANPGTLNFASGGVATTPHLAPELFDSMAGIKMTHVPYKGGGNALNALLAGEVQVYFVNGIASVAQHVKSGRLKALAVTSAEPTPLAPGLPTVAASGLPGYESVGKTGIFTAAKTPAAAINRLNQEIVRFLRTPEAKERFLSAGIEVVGSTPEALAAAVQSELATMSKLVKDANIRLE